MIFGIVLIIFILAVAFIHFVQGFFSATLSAIFAVIAAVVAVGYHENVVAMFKPSKMADSANAMMLCALFATTYLLLRILFDRMLPGNVRLQSTVDKVGAAIMGLVAGTMAAGIVAIAAQTMSFGPSVFGYARYALAPERQASFQTERGRQSLQRNITDEIKSGVFEDKDVNHLLLPADDIVLNLVNTVSSGSLSGKQAFNSVHPDYLREAFGTRIGIEVGAKRTATNFEGVSQVTVDHIAYRTVLKSVEDSEFPEIRGKTVSAKDVPNEPRSEIKPAKEDFKVPDSKHVILIVRAVFDINADDEKSDIFRFSPASIRLVTHPGGDPTKPAKDYHPIGTMDNWANPGGGPTLWPNHIDDPLFSHGEGGNGADLVFLVDDTDEVLEGAVAETGKKKTDAKPTANYQIKPGTFLEVKRLARVDLSGKLAESGPLPADPKINVMRKVRLKQPPKDVPPPT